MRANASHSGQVSAEKTTASHGGRSIQIPPSRLSEDQALQRLLLGFFFGDAGLTSYLLNFEVTPAFF